MPTRTVTMTHLTVHKRYNKKPEDYRVLSKVNGSDDLLHVFHSVLKSAIPAGLATTLTERYVRLDSLQPVGRTLLIEATVGSYGEEGAITNVKTHKDEYKHGRDGAQTATVRALLVIPRDQKHGLLFVEHVGQRQVGKALLDYFTRVFRYHYGSDLTFAPEVIVESAAWLVAAEAEELEIRSYAWSADIADAGIPKVVGLMTRVLKPPRGRKYLSLGLLDVLRADKAAASRILGLGEEMADDVIVTASADGKTKRFKLGFEKQPVVSYVLAEGDDPFPSAQTFRRFCLEEVEQTLADVGGSWQTSWERGQWPTDALNLDVAVPDE